MNAANDTRERMALLALSHTPAEQRLYEALLSESARAGDGGEPSLSLRGLLALTGLNSYSTLRRARAGLVAKLSIDCRREPEAGGRGGASQSAPTTSLYRVFRPAEVFERRHAAGIEPFPKEYRRHAAHAAFSAAIERVANGYNLSRREAQVALCCAEGLTNSEIGAKLFITEQTVKFHLRHVFVKFGVRRRAELISRLLRERDDVGGARAVYGQTAAAEVA
jgi:DNA-binding CsgD family transcriptional regulator